MTAAPAGWSLRLLQLASAISAFDRFVVVALLVSISVDLDVRLGAVAPVAGWYFLCYGLSQPFWGLCSDWLGRARTMQVALAMTAVGGLASALAPTLPLLIAARAFTGACIAAVVPSALIYVGDAVPLAHRQRTLTDINSATAVGITAATVLGGFVASSLSWRVAFLLPVLPAVALVVGLRWLPPPPSSPARRGRVVTVLRHTWGRAVLGLAVLEGFILLGLLTYFAPSLESHGFTASTAGAVVGCYGIGLLIASRVVRRLALSTTPATFLVSGSLGLAVAYVAVALSQSGWVVASAALLVGAAWAALHSTMQTWATEVVPGSRAAMVSLFAGMLFAGGGLGTAALAPLAGALRWQPLFVTGAVLALLFGGLAATTQRTYARYDTSPRRPPAPPVL